MKTTDREVASCRKGYTRKRNPFARYQTYVTADGRRFEFLNGDKLAKDIPSEERGLPPLDLASRSLCEICGWGYAELVRAKTCVCSECRGEMLVDWGIEVQEWLGLYEPDMRGVDLGWRREGGNELADVKSSGRRRLESRGKRTQATDLKGVNAKG